MVKWRGRKLSRLTGEKRELLAKIDLVRCQRTNQILGVERTVAKIGLAAGSAGKKYLFSNNRTVATATDPTRPR